MVDIEVVTPGTKRLTMLQALVALAVARARSVDLAGMPEVLPVQVTEVSPGLALIKAVIALRSLATTGPRSPR